MVVNIKILLNKEVEELNKVNLSLLENSLMVDDEQKSNTSKTVWSVVLFLNLAIFIISKLSMLKLSLTKSSILQNPHYTLFFIEVLEKLIVTPISTMIVVFDLINNSGPPFSKIIPNCGLRFIFLLLLNIMLLGGISTAHMRFIAIRYTQIMVQWGEVEIMSSILML